jgi:hypothetical protein
VSVHLGTQSHFVCTYMGAVAPCLCGRSEGESGADSGSTLLRRAGSEKRSGDQQLQLVKGRQYALPATRVRDSPFYLQGNVGLRQTACLSSCIQVSKFILAGSCPWVRADNWTETRERPAIRLCSTHTGKWRRWRSQRYVPLSELRDSARNELFLLIPSIQPKGP